MATSKAKISCSHLFINGSICKKDDVVEIDSGHLKNILEADKKANRKPRIEKITVRKTSMKKTSAKTPGGED